MPSLPVAAPELLSFQMRTSTRTPSSAFLLSSTVQYSAV